jgi:small subunit ribosomal protein S9
MAKKEISIEKQIISGKRKTSVAKLRVKPGNGNVTFNSLPSSELPLFYKLALAEPVRIYEKALGEKPKYDLHVKVTGGGKSSQIQAARLAIARTLLKISSSETLKKAFVAYDRHLLVQDARRKEAYKPGDSKARAKRQKSYR